MDFEINKMKILNYPPLLEDFDLLPVGYVLKFLILMMFNETILKCIHLYIYM
jgi:hypothetical protein